jgi:cyclohexyl-isocyanide hydratase
MSCSCRAASKEQLLQWTIWRSSISFADRGERAKFVTSVCTGSLLLGAAGLLRGYAATSHWYVRDLPGLIGASAKADRVVVDRNRVTGAGVTAGLDFSFELARQLRGEETPRLFELVLEYDPKPPFPAGTPELAGAPLTDRVRQIRLRVPRGRRWRYWVSS